MKTPSRRLMGIVIVPGLAAASLLADASAGEAALAYYRQAKINWRQFEGQKLTIGLNKHP